VDVKSVVWDNRSIKHIADSKTLGFTQFVQLVKEQTEVLLEEAGSTRVSNKLDVIILRATNRTVTLEEEEQWLLRLYL